MFVLSLIKDNVRTAPAEFGRPRGEALTNELNRKYANKILHDVGFCIRVWDIIEATDEVVHMVQDGSSQTKVTFRMVVFRPFKGEILTGKVLSNHATEGLKGMCSPYLVTMCCWLTFCIVSMEFFSDITIPPAFLQAGTEL
ncbi:hypothetical protein DFS34DRAFT_565204, partial [Phlyctochytrium arcticum]